MTEGAYPLVEKKKGVILVVSSNSATLPQLKHRTGGHHVEPKR